MKTKYKSHIKFDSCWYNNFFKVKPYYKPSSSKIVELKEENKKQLAATSKSLQKKYENHENKK